MEGGENLFETFALHDESILRQKHYVADSLLRATIHSSGGRIFHDVSGAAQTWRAVWLEA